MGEITRCQQPWKRQYRWRKTFCRNRKKHLFVSLEAVKAALTGYRITGYAGDMIVTRMVGDFGCFGRAIYVPSGAKNVVSLGRLRMTRRDYKVDYMHDRGFTVTSPGGEVYRFDIDKDGLYR